MSQPNVLPILHRVSTRRVRTAPRKRKEWTRLLLASGVIGIDGTQFRSGRQQSAGARIETRGDGAVHARSVDDFHRRNRLRGLRCSCVRLRKRPRTRKPSNHHFVECRQLTAGDGTTGASVRACRSRHMALPQSGRRAILWRVVTEVAQLLSF